MGRTIAVAVGALLLATVGYLTFLVSGSKPNIIEPPAHSEPAEIRSVLVVPFRTSLQDPQFAYLSAAMAEGLVSRLRPVLNARVAESVAAIPGEAPMTTGARLGADVVISGLVEQQGRILKVSLALVSVANTQPFPSLTSEAQTTELFALQDQMALQVATTLQPDLPLDARSALTQKASASTRAYGLLIRARDAWTSRNPESIDDAIGLYTAAVDLDPSFVRAHAELAIAYGTLEARTDPLVRQPYAIAAAARAVALDATSPAAQAALAFVRYRFEWRWADAAAAFTRALASNPRDALVHQLFGQYLHAVGRSSDALAEFGQALDLEPDSPAIRADMVAPLLSTGQTSEARSMVDAIRALDPEWAQLDALDADVYAAEGLVAESAASWWRALLAQGVPAERVDALRVAFRAGGFDAMTKRWIVQLRREVDAGPTPPSSFRLATDLALAHARLSNREETLSWLAVAIDLHEDAPLLMLSTTAFNFVRADPQFQELLRRSNHAPSTQHPAPST
ncbi:MAG: tetratricopeptide repeat protein [Acidobacteria bacterium]|nr:tetratricopeptide repeat protein [Acidobacteriota bacterium]